MSWPSGTFPPEEFGSLSLFSDDNSNQTQIGGEQNVVKEMVGLDLSDRSSNKKQKKLRSKVWNHFEKYIDENGKDWAKCNHCEKVFDGSSKMGTTHLMNHFKCCSKNKSNEGGGSASGDKPAENSNQTQIGEQNVVKEMVGLDLGESSHKKQKKRRSEVWKNFEKYKDENGKDWAKCNICKNPFNGSSKQGTTRLKNHFESCSKKRKNEGGGSASGDKPAEDSVMDQQLNHLDRVKMLIKHCSPFQPLPKSIEAADIINVYKEEKEKLRIYFEKLPCRFFLMIDTDLSSFGVYICFSVYFIDDDWKLKEEIISWKCIGGDPIMKILKNLLSEWGIDNKISYMVLDGYSYEHFLSSNERENGFSSQGSLLFNGKLFCVCDFHYIIVIYSDCIDEIKYVLYDRMKEIFKYITGNGNFQIAIDRAKSLGKKVTTGGGIPTEQFLRVMAVAQVVEMGLGLKEAFFELENMESEFKSINLTKEEWDLISIFSDFTPHAESHLYSCEAANMYFPWICNIYTISLESVKLEPSIYENESFHSFGDGMKCWYDHNLVLAVAAVLDPRFKMDIVKHWYKKIYGDEYETRLAKFKDYLTSVYNEYAKGTNNFQSYEMLDPSGKPCKHYQSPNTELHLYLEDVKFPLIQEFNILDWWRSNTQYFPTLAKMARDFLSIRITIPNDHLLSGIPIPHTHRDSDMVKEEASVCVRHWLRWKEFQ